MGKTLVTSALPYANGPLHLGHIAGCYLPADIYVRYLKVKNENVIHICGTDEHGVPITISAEKEGKSPKELVDHYYELIKNSFERLNISFDYFGRTTRDHHKSFSQNFFLRLYEKGFIEKREEKNYYCFNCQRFLPDRYIEGTCPYCKSEGARGDQCEFCGRWLEAFELLDPKCKICGNTPHLKDTFNYYFLLPKLKEDLENWLKEKKSWKDFVRNFALSWVREGLRARSITRDLSWGVPVPLEEAKSKVLYVWFDAPIGYITITQEWAFKVQKDWEDWWKNREVRLVHFLGKDNIVFHAVIWPCMLMAHGDFILPSEIPANQYLVTKEGKMSTSRGMALWLDDFLDKYHPDYIRFGIARVLPETKDSEFSIEDFEKDCDTYLSNDIGNLFSRVFKLFERYFSLRVPEKKIEGEFENRMWSVIKEKSKKVEENFDNFKFRQALQEIIEIAQEVNRYIDFTKPWDVLKNDKSKGGKIIYNSLSAIRLLSCLLFPFLPYSMRKLRNSLGLNDPLWDEVYNPFLDEGKILRNVEIIFPRIRENLKEEVLKEKKDYVSIEDFNKLDLVVGRIVNVYDIEGSDKLYRLEVDIGKEVKTLVAGIKESYSKDELKGKNVIILNNLKPRKIKGILSEGMLLAVEKDKGGIVLLTTEKLVEPGLRVS
ncbi:MAG: methionine--tRNA ligase [Candidatus Hydrothermales bacterium]